MLSPQAQRLWRHLQTCGHLPPGSSCLIALSGGGDSVALTLLLAELRSRMNLKLYAAHLDHGLRPESADDALFARQLCQDLDIPLFALRRDAQDFAASRGLSLEEAGRVLRYRLFRRALDKYGAHYLLTAHTASDQAETLLMRLVAGTGPSGLCGIRPRRAFGPHVIVRPLLIFSGQELRDYLRQRGQDWREDSTNHIPDAPRTRVRWQLLPLLQSWNPQVVEALNRLSRYIRADEEMLQRRAARLRPHFAPCEQGLQIPWRELAQAPLPCSRRALRWALHRLNCPAEAYHLEGIGELIAKAPAPHRLDLPGKTVALIRGEMLYLGPALTPASAPEPVSFGADPGFFSRHLPHWQLSLSLSPAPISARPQRQRIFLDPQKLKGELTLRSRREGDCFMPAGGRGRTKLKKYLNEARISADLRDCVPLLCCGEDIVWVVGQRADQRYLARPQQSDVIEATVTFDSDSPWFAPPQDERG